MTYDPDNIIAKIIRGDLPAFKVYEDGSTLAFMDIHPQVKGHTLVVPKTAGIDMLSTTDEDLTAAIITTNRVAKAIDKVLNPDGIMVTQLNRASAGQSIFHTHFHILPRWEGQQLKSHNAVPADMEELEAMAKDFAAAII
jgi:histidine triad (HIT) family protein